MTEKKDEVHNDDWMIRPCDMYKEEYSDCRSIKARFHQYFIFGESIDCSQWKRDFDNCIKWEKSQDEAAYKDLIRSETQRRFDRLRPHYANDVWKRRTEPPKDWNKPLPEWMVKEHESSYLEFKAQAVREGTEENLVKRYLCTIS